MPENTAEFSREEVAAMTEAANKLKMNQRMNKMTKMTKRRMCQTGGGASDYVGSFHAWQADPASLTRYTEARIGNSPMFNPFNQTAVFATGTSGIIPTGQYYMTGGSNKCNSKGRLMNRLVKQSGGNKQSRQTKQTKQTKQNNNNNNNAWVDHVKHSMTKYGLSYREALSDSRVRSSYHSTK